MAMQAGDQDGPVTGINVTPLVDVCLVLVIIFMVATPLLQQPNLPVTLPKAKTKEGEEKANVTITVTAEDKWAINAEEMLAADIHKKLPVYLASNPDKLVVIRADRAAHHGQLMAAMAAAKAAGALSITIATEQKDVQ